MKRRRFLTITAAAGVLAATPARAFRLDPVEWRGVALGAAARLIIHHEDRDTAERLLADCLAEVERLERIFSLYRPDSALVRLNRDGHVNDPPHDLLILLGEVDRFWSLSEGAFDPTVQPLWQAYARHFSVPDADPDGPAPEILDSLRPRLGWPKVRLSEASVTFGHPGMAVTLNGIAQGYVTDRVAARMSRAGMRHVLIDLGELRVLGPDASGRRWRIGTPGGDALELDAGAVATSMADGTRFSPACHHLFDPVAGRSAASQRPMTVLAATATIADAVSTACAVAPRLAAPLSAALGCRLL